MTMLSRGCCFLNKKEKEVLKSRMWQRNKYGCLGARHLQQACFKERWESPAEAPEAQGTLSHNSLFYGAVGASSLFPWFPSTQGACAPICGKRAGRLSKAVISLLPWSAENTFQSIICSCQAGGEGSHLPGEQTDSHRNLLFLISY